MSLERIDSLGLDSFRSTLIFLDGETSMGLTTSLTGGLTVSLTTSFAKGLEEDEGTKFVEWGVDKEMLSTKPNPDLRRRLLNNVKTENMLLLDKVKSLKLDLSVARSASSKLDQMLSIQKSPSQIWIRFC